jgi:hypothetical protein
LSLAHYLDTGEMVLPRIPPGRSHDVNGAACTWPRRDFEAANQLTDAAESAWRVALGSGWADLPVRLLPTDEWCCGLQIREGTWELNATLDVRMATFELPAGGTVPAQDRELPWTGIPQLQTATAALIFPEAPIVVSEIKPGVLRELATLRLQQRASLADALAQAPEKVLDAAFAGLFQQYPSATHDIERISFELRSQRIRFPEQVVNSESRKRHGATCVDYALLLCAILEASGLPPVFVVVGTSTGDCHALAGAWLGGVQTGDVLQTNAATLLGHMDAGSLAVVDVTSFATGESYATALQRARECLSQAPYQLCYALDVKAARDIHGIRPLPRRPGSFSKVLPPRIVHPLDRAGKFQVRPESEKLRAFWESDHHGSLLGVIAMGGSGKTALVERFLCEMPGSTVENPAVRKQPELPAPAALFVWSFYRVPKCEEFLEQLASYLEGDSPVEPDLRKQVEKIQAALERRVGLRNLLVLDGLEKLQKERDIPGQFADEASPLREFLRWAAARPTHVQIVVTSRFVLADLADWKENGYVELIVDELDPAAGRALLRASGVTGGDKELDKLGKAFGWHALTLTHVGGLLARFYRGDPSKAMNLPPLKKIQGLDLQAQRLARILAHYEERLSAEEVGILKAVAAFRLPVTAAAIAGTFAAQPLASFQGGGVLLPDEWQLKMILNQLTDLRLLQEYRDSTGELCYASHPAITQYFYSALLEDTRLVHEGASRYLERELERHQYRLKGGGRRPVRTRGISVRSSPDRGELPRDRAVLDLLEELIYHAVKAERLEEAYQMYLDNLGGYRHLGARLGEYLRGQRIVSLFLGADSASLPLVTKYPVDLEYKLYQDALALQSKV